jgi:hypothetical protein
MSTAKKSKRRHVSVSRMHPAAAAGLPGGETAGPAGALPGPAGPTPPGGLPMMADADTQISNAGADDMSEMA